ncbi:SRR1-like protein isoform X1 [Achroia grisella]|uniref:SRR1-like protein isoform X1 n=1 Tax=Achroia grisella TaxID=688607 RepID=UPI0027D25ED8|nr:SRR1-like protein isoform X1 [Achroia grisella]
MSNFRRDSDGFQIVKTKRLSKNKQTKIPTKQTNFETQEVIIDFEKSTRRIQTAVEELRNSKYTEDALKSVSNVISSRKVVEIVCFGLGHISECHISRHQLAFLLCMKDYCDPIKVLVHDPIFYQGECDILKHFNIEVIEQNIEGNYVISDRDITLLYFPHCPKQLTNNFLWTNWGLKLSNCVLICNSFNALIESQPSRLLSETVTYIYKIFPFTSEIVLENNFKYTDIFNDTSIHWFPKEKLDTVNEDLWKKIDKPTYDNTEEFITSQMVEKLKL